MEHFQDLLHVVCWWVQTPIYTHKVVGRLGLIPGRNHPFELIMGVWECHLTVVSTQLLVPLWGDFRRSSARCWSIHPLFDWLYHEHQNIKPFRPPKNQHGNGQMDQLKMYCLHKMGNFQCHVSFHYIFSFELNFCTTTEHLLETNYSLQE